MPPEENAKEKEKEKKAKAKVKAPTEAVEQKALCEWLTKMGIKHFATSMGVWFGKTNYKYINSLKTRGFESGVPDIVILLDNGVTAFIELKRRNGRPSDIRPVQKEWIKWLEEHGYPVKVCYGCIDAMKFVIQLKGGSL